MRHFPAQVLAAAVALSPVLCAAGSSAPLATGQALQVILGLFLVLGMIMAAAWVARRLQAIRPQGSGHIRVIEGLAVGTRDRLLLVEVDGERVLLGMSPGRIATLHTLGAGGAPRFEEALHKAARELTVEQG